MLQGRFFCYCTMKSWVECLHRKYHGIIDNKKLFPIAAIVLTIVNNALLRTITFLRIIWRITTTSIPLFSFSWCVMLNNHFYDNETWLIYNFGMLMFESLGKLAWTQEEFTSWHLWYQRTLHALCIAI